jgi:hypothetical protein
LPSNKKKKKVEGCTLSQRVVVVVIIFGHCCGCHEEDGKKGYRLQSDKIKMNENAGVAIVVLYYIGVCAGEKWWGS